MKPPDQPSFARFLRTASRTFTRLCPFKAVLEILDDRNEGKFLTFSWILKFCWIFCSRRTFQGQIRFQITAQLPFKGFQDHPPGFIDERAVIQDKVFKAQFSSKTTL